jgi:hypothetical protein
VKSPLRAGSMWPGVAKGIAASMQEFVNVIEHAVHSFIAFGYT